MGNKDNAQSKRAVDAREKWNVGFLNHISKKIKNFRKCNVIFLFPDLVRNCKIKNLPRLSFWKGLPFPELICCFFGTTSPEQQMLEI